MASFSSRVYFVTEFCDNDVYVVCCDDVEIQDLKLYWIRACKVGCTPDPLPDPGYKALIQIDLRLQSIYILSLFLLRNPIICLGFKK